MRVTLHGGVEAGSQAQADPEGKNAERGRDLARRDARAVFLAAWSRSLAGSLETFDVLLQPTSVAQAAFFQLPRS